MGIQKASITDLANEMAVPEIEADDLVRALFPVVQTLGTTLQGMTTTEIIAQALSKYLFNSGADAPDDNDKVEGRRQIYLHVSATAIIGSYYHSGVIVDDWAEFEANRNPEGILIGRSTIAPGDYPTPPSIYQPWVLGADAPSNFTISDYSEDADAGLFQDVKKRVTPNQAGFVNQIKVDGVVVAEALSSVGYQSFNLVNIEISAADFSSQANDFRLQLISQTQDYGVRYNFRSRSPLTIAVGDPVITAEVRIWNN